MFTFKIIGKSGQGVKTCTRLLGRAAHVNNFHVQDFFLHGPNWPSKVEGYVKMDKKEITDRDVPESMDFLIVLDPEENTQKILKTLQKDTVVLANTETRIKKSFAKKYGVKVFTLDAKKIGAETLRKPLSNTAMLGALAGVYTKITMKSLRKAIELEGLEMPNENMEAVERGYQAVK
jgi:pyruvate ferredoxin oxidoreductase gamma subunit